MTTSQRTAISSPATGLLVFDNTTGSFWFYNGSTWEDLSETVTADQIADADDDTKIQVEENNDEDIIRFDINGAEKFKMLDDVGFAKIMLVNNDENIIIGAETGDILPIGNQNVAIGHQAGDQLTSGGFNTFLGSRSGKLLETGEYM